MEKENHNGDLNVVCWFLNGFDVVDVRRNKEWFNSILGGLEVANNHFMDLKKAANIIF